MPDLRLDHPLPPLIKMLESINFDELSDKEHSHIPYVLILLHHLNIWKASYGEFPKNYKEKKLFIESVKQGL